MQTIGYTQRTTVRTRIPGQSWDVLLTIGHDDPVCVGTVTFECHDHDFGEGYYATPHPGHPCLIGSDHAGPAFDSKRRAVAELVAHHHHTR